MESLPSKDMHQALEHSVPIVGILSAIADVEHPAILEAFGVDQNRKEDENIDGDRYWFSFIERSDGMQLRVVISCVARSGNANPQIPVERMANQFQPEAMFFVGIACGLNSLNLGDVVTSEQVYDYEYSKVTPPDKPDLDRSRIVSCVEHLITDLHFFKAKEDWHNDFGTVLKKFPTDKLPRQIPSPRLHPPVWIASGEKVLADGRLTILNTKNDNIKAGEMEGYGFAIACAKRRPPVPWLVIRGISDHGDPTKDGAKEGQTTPAVLKDEYHVAAAVAAATFLRKFLETTYTPETQRPNRNTGMTGTLSDRQIIDMVANGLLISEEFSLNNVEQACYELRVGNVYYELDGDRKQRQSTDGFETIILKPRRLTVVITKETLNLPADVLGRILTKGRLFSAGILPVNTYADPGFRGKLGIVFYNASQHYLKLPVDEPMAKIEFSKLAERVEKPYEGQHGYQSDMWPMPENVFLTTEELSKDPRCTALKDETIAESVQLEIDAVKSELIRKENRIAKLECLTKFAFALILLGLAFMIVQLLRK